MRRHLVSPLLLLAAACGRDEPTSPTAQPSTRSAIVAPGSSIQAAIDAAGPGDVIHIRPGLYREALRVDKAGIKLMGQSNSAGAVVLENPGDVEYGAREWWIAAADPTPRRPVLGRVRCRKLLGQEPVRLERAGRTPGLPVTPAWTMPRNPAMFGRPRRSHAAVRWHQRLRL